MINVVAAIIRNKEGKILIAQRNLKKSQGGLWEFPGGKIEENETREEAIVREIKEELEMDIKVISYFDEKLYEYGDMEVKRYYGSQTFNISIKDQNNQIHSLSGNLSSDRINLSEKDSNKLHTLLLENTELKFSLISEGSTYKFTLKDNTDYSLMYEELEKSRK